MEENKSQSEIAHLSGIVERGFAALADDVAGIKREVTGLKTEMLDQFQHVDAQFGATNDRLRDIAAELAEVQRGLERLDQLGASNAGFAKEIDHAFSRIAAIEKHLGLSKKAA